MSDLFHVSLMTDLLTPGEVAELFNVNPRTVKRWADAGKLPHVLTAGRAPAVSARRGRGPAEGLGAAMTDLMAALQRSLREAARRRDEAAELEQVDIAGRPYVTGDREQLAERLGLTTQDVAELTWDDRSAIEEDARYEARRPD